MRTTGRVWRSALQADGTSLESLSDGCCVLPGDQETSHPAAFHTFFCFNSARDHEYRLWQNQFPLFWLWEPHRPKCGIPSSGFPLYGSPHKHRRDGEAEQEIERGSCCDETEDLLSSPGWSWVITLTGDIPVRPAITQSAASGFLWPFRESGTGWKSVWLLVFFTAVNKPWIKHTRLRLLSTDQQVYF